MPLYPLRMTPVLKQYLWGGRRLGTELGKTLGPEPHYAESWEICDRGRDQSAVAAGPLAGVTLAELLTRHGAELLGRHHPQPRFPLLFKLLDAQQRLSVQVHPDDARATRLEPPDLGKTEAWVVLDAQPGSVIWAGLKRGFDRPALARELARGTCELCLHTLSPRPGDCLFLPAGAVHAMGEGLLMAEIQQSSDVTYRLFDWNRVGPDGRSRPLHIEPALEAIDYSLGPRQFQVPQATDQPHAQRLAACDKFVLDRWEFEQTQTCGGDERFHILCVIEGLVTIDGDAIAAGQGRGGVWLIPASCGPVTVRPQGRGVVLDIHLP